MCLSGPLNGKLAVVYLMVWYQVGTNQLSKAMIIPLINAHILVNRNELMHFSLKNWSHRCMTHFSLKTDHIDAWSWLLISWLLKSVATWLFVKQPSAGQQQRKHHSPVLLPKGLSYRKCFHVMTSSSTGPHLNIKTVLSTCGDFHVKDKTAVRTSYL